MVLFDPSQDFQVLIERPMSQINAHETFYAPLEVAEPMIRWETGEAKIMTVHSYSYDSYDEDGNGFSIAFSQGCAVLFPGQADLPQTMETWDVFRE